MCGGFTCSKNTLIGLNVIYIFVAILLMGVASAAKSAGYVSSLPVVGGIIASGVFLLFVAIVGLIGAFRHHQVTLFFYMVVLFAIFVIQFSVACASLAASPEDEINIMKKAWDALDDAGKDDAQRALDCCGFMNVTETTTCTADCVVNKTNRTNCEPCQEVMYDKVNYGFNSAGGVGLFFAFTEIIGTVLAYRYRNLMDPSKAAAAATNVYNSQPTYS